MGNDECKKMRREDFFLDVQRCCCYGNITLNMRLFAEKSEVVQV
jgi:hypothetical protein